MKTSKYLIPVLLCILISICSPAQSMRKKGTVYTNYGDTLQGWITVYPKRKTPKSVTFRKDSSSRLHTTFEPFELIGFDIPGYGSYTSFDLTMDDRPVGDFYEALLPVDRDQSKQGVFFLQKIITGGELELYQHIDDKEHFFLKEKGGDPYELRYIIGTATTGNGKMYEEEGITTIHDYKRQLLHWNMKHGNDPRVVPIINILDYSLNDLRHIVLIMNSLKGGPTIDHNYTQQSIKVKRHNYYVGGAIGVYVPSHFEAPYLPHSAVTMPRQVVKQVFIGQEWRPDVDRNSIIFRQEIKWQTCEFTGSSEPDHLGNDKTDFVYRLNNVGIGLMAGGQFFERENIRLYSGCLVDIFYSWATVNRYRDASGYVYPGYVENEFIKYSRYNFSLKWRSGIRFRRRFDLHYTVSFLDNFFNPDRFYVKSPGFLGFTYHLSK